MIHEPFFHKNKYQESILLNVSKAKRISMHNIKNKIKIQNLNNVYIPIKKIIRFENRCQVPYHFSLLTYVDNYVFR